MASLSALNSPFIGNLADEPISLFGTPVRPGHVTIDSAMLTRSVFDPDGVSYSGAVYNANGALVQASLRQGSAFAARPVDPAAIVRRALRDQAEKIPAAIYGGHFFFAWGHFLIETLATAANDGLPDAPIIFLPWMFTGTNAWVEGYIEHVRPMLAAAWDDRPLRVAYEPMRFDKLVLPSRLTAYGMAGPTIHPAVRTVFDRIRTRLAEPRSARRLVIVREADHRRAHPLERDLCDALAAAGFEPIAPHTMTVREQVSRMAAAETVIGFSGSALHNSVFMQAGATVVEVGDTPQQDAGNSAQSQLCRICGQKLIFVPGYRQQTARSGQDIHDEVIDRLTSLVAA
jgi:capsular polysaccharide biosynthesis protein